MNKTRLLAAARAVLDADPELFTMAREVNACGTPACVFGHYAARVDLQDKFVLHERNDEHYAYISERAHPEDEIGAYAESVREHFGLTREQQMELFDIDGCGNAKTPREAADYIEAFVASDGKITP